MNVELSVANFINSVIRLKFEEPFIFQ